jgi:serine kinase of HPr protein (carbohydrate metabolism regulator)
MLNVHATCVAIGDGAVLIRGPSGAGKSDLALRLIDGGAVLVADDRTLLAVEADCLVARPAPPIAGLLEVRGVGLVALHHRPEAPVRLVCDLVPADRVERMPDPAMVAVLGVTLPRVRLCAFHAGTVAALRLLLAGAPVRHPAPLTA